MSLSLGVWFWLGSALALVCNSLWCWCKFILAHACPDGAPVFGLVVYPSGLGLPKSLVLWLSSVSCFSWVSASYDQFISSSFSTCGSLILFSYYPTSLLLSPSFRLLLPEILLFSAGFCNPRCVPLWKIIKFWVKKKAIERNLHSYLFTRLRPAPCAG